MISDQNAEPAPDKCAAIPPRFLADRMVGKLAKWLRIIGYDTVYLPQLSPEGVKREARRQGRLLLTRSTRFLNQKDVPPFVFIQSDRFRDQLKQVCADLQLDVSTHLFTRCSVCNQELAAVEREHVQQHVPEYVWQTRSTFLRCKKCPRVYWGATHRERVLEELRQLGVLQEVCSAEEASPAGEK